MTYFSLSEADIVCFMLYPFLVVTSSPYDVRPHHWTDFTRASRRNHTDVPI